MFVLVLAVPALLVVVLGCVVGHAVWTWLTGLLDPAPGTLASGAEPAGWITGVLLLVAVVRILAVRRRRRG